MPEALATFVNVRSPDPMAARTSRAWDCSGNSAARARSPLTSSAEVGDARAWPRYSRTDAPQGHSPRMSGRPPLTR
jgi:hypothetical protein